MIIIKTASSLHPQSLRDQMETIDLQSCINIAVMQNPKLITERLNRQDDWKLHRLQFREFFPELAVKFSKSDSVTYNAPDSRINSLGFSVNQKLFNSGNDIADYRSAGRELKLRDLSSADLRDNIIYQVSHQYIEILKYREILNVQRQSLDNLDTQVRIAEMEYDLGGLTRSDLLDIKIRRSQYSLNLRDNNEQVLQKRYNLASLMDLSVSDLPPLAGTLDLDYVSQTALTEADSDRTVPLLTGMALDFSKELQSSYLKERNARRDVFEARFCWLPEIEATADVRFTGSRFPLSQPSFSMGLNFSFDAPLLPGRIEVQTGRSNPSEHNRSIRSETGVLENLDALVLPSIARNRLENIHRETEELKRQISFRVQALIHSIQFNSHRCAHTRENAALETDRLEIEGIRLETGELTRLDYVKAEVRLANHKTELIEAVAALYRDEMELAMICGTVPDSERDSQWRLIINQEE
ncbi:MAG: TolC family protein [Spirochaetales bacterium]|nr:TolC family protein [Spirochaetales bacterium]